MSNQQETYEDMKIAAINTVKAGLEIKKFYEKVKENQVEKMLMEKYKEMPFTFRGDHTDLSYFWGHKSLHMSEIEKLEPTLQDKVKQNIAQYQYQDKLIKFNRETNEYTLTRKGKKLINTKQFHQDVRNASYATDNILQDAIRNSVDENNNRPKTVTGDGIHDYNEPYVESEGVEQQFSHPVTGDQVHDYTEPHIESEGIPNKEIEDKLERGNEINSSKTAVTEKAADNIPEYVRINAVNDVFEMSGDIVDLSYFLCNDKLTFKALEKLNVEPALSKIVNENLIGLKKEGFIDIDIVKKEITVTKKGKELINSPKFIQKLSERGLSKSINQVNTITKGVVNPAKALKGGIVSTAVEGTKAIKKILTR